MGLFEEAAETSWWIYDHFRINEAHLPGTVTFITNWLAWTVQRASKLSIHHESKEGRAQ